MQKLPMNEKKYSMWGSSVWLYVIKTLEIFLISMYIQNKPIIACTPVAFPHMQDKDIEFLLVHNLLYMLIAKQYVNENSLAASHLA